MNHFAISRRTKTNMIETVIEEKKYFLGELQKKKI